MFTQLGGNIFQETKTLSFEVGKQRGRKGKWEGASGKNKEGETHYAPTVKEEGYFPEDFASAHEAVELESMSRPSSDKFCKGKILSSPFYVHICETINLIFFV